MLRPVGQCEQLAPALAGGRDHRGGVGDRLQQRLQRRPAGVPGRARRAADPRAFWPRADALGGQLGVVALLHHEGERQAGFRHRRRRLVECAVDRRLVLGKRLVPDAHHVEQGLRDLAHQVVLRFVLDAGPAAPCRDDQRRNEERLVQRRQRIDGVAEARVLEHHGAVAARQPGAGGDRHRLALARRADVLDRGIANDPIDDRGQEGTRHARIEIEPARLGGAEKVVGIDHKNRPASLRSPKVSTSSH